MRFAALLCLLALMGGDLAAQAQPAQPGRCQLRILHADTGTTLPGPNGTVNYFARGDVRLTCEGQNVFMQSDSLEAFGGKVVQFLGRVKYRDSTITMDADQGTYYKEGERWEARGNVFTRNLRSGSSLKGPVLDYFRAVPGVRDSIELYAVGRPRIEYVVADSLGKPAEPYIIYADRVRMKGDDQVWGGGKVTIDRSDFASRSDSLRLDTGAGSDGTLLGGSPILRGLGADSFTLKGRRIDLQLERKQLTYVTAKTEGHAISGAWDLTADTIALDVEGRKLVQTLAWGDSTRPFAYSPDYAIRADSLALDTPGQMLKETRAYGKAWVGGALDSLTKDRDWLAGDTVIAQFTQRDSAGTSRSVLQRIDARKDARSLYRVSDVKRPGAPSLNYSRGDRIVVSMKGEGQGEVDRVDVQGNADGAQLEPLAPGARDSTAVTTSPEAKGQ